jgi:hypothetical protein
VPARGGGNQSSTAVYGDTVSWVPDRRYLRRLTRRVIMVPMTRVFLVYTQKYPRMMPEKPDTKKAGADRMTLW